MFDPRFDPSSRRLTICYTGFWKPQDARAFVSQFRNELDKVARSGAFTLLDDLRDWPTQSQEVAEITRDFASAVGHAPITRNAMVIPQQLLRMQVSRTLKDLPNCSVFSTFEEADGWLKEVEPPNRA